MKKSISISKSQPERGMTSPSGNLNENHNSRSHSDLPLQLLSDRRPISRQIQPITRCGESLDSLPPPGPSTPNFNISFSPIWFKKNQTGKKKIAFQCNPAEKRLRYPQFLKNHQIIIKMKLSIATTLSLLAGASAFTAPSLPSSAVSTTQVSETKVRLA